MKEKLAGWFMSTLSNAGNWGSGGTPLRTNNEYYENGTIPWLVIGDLNDGYVIEAKNKITEKGLLNSSAKLVPAGTLLIAMYGSIGKLGLTKIACATNQAIAFCEIDEELFYKKYLFYFLLNSRKSLISLGKGGAQQNISQTVLKGFPVAIAPLNEQIRISNKLDSLLAKVNATQIRLEKIPTLLKRFRQSVLAAATSGQLTNEWSGRNKNSDLVNELSIISKHRASIVSKRDAIPKKHLENEEYKTPNTWTWVSLDMLASKIVDGVHFKPDYVDSGIPFMSVKDIKDGKISFENCKYVSLETHREIHARCNPERGDLLITKSGTIGRTAIVNTDDIFDLFVSVALIKPASSLVNMHFVDFALQNWINSIDISSRVIGTAIKNLHLQDMRVLAIPFPPLEEQKEIVRRVETLFSLADNVEKQYLEAKKRTDRLTQSLLAKAFRGELVPQDTNDEPASELLKRIQAERAVQSEIKPIRKTVTASKKEKKVVMKLHEAPEHYLLDLLTQLGGEIDAKVLWNKTELGIDDFYAKLKQEMQTGRIVDDKASSDPTQRKLKLA